MAHCGRNRRLDKKKIDESGGEIAYTKTTSKNKAWMMSATRMSRRIWAFVEGVSIAPNENKMSDGHRERTSPEVNAH